MDLPSQRRWKEASKISKKAASCSSCFFLFHLFLFQWLFSIFFVYRPSDSIRCRRSNRIHLIGSTSIIHAAWYAAPTASGGGVSSSGSRASCWWLWWCYCSYYWPKSLGRRPFGKVHTDTEKERERDKRREPTIVGRSKRETDGYLWSSRRWYPVVMVI